MRESMNGDEFVYPAKRKVYHREISKHTRAMVADKKATRNLCQTRFTATKRKVIAQQCCASIVQQDEKKFKKLSIIGTVWNVPAQEKKKDRRHLPTNERCDLYASRNMGQKQWPGKNKGVTEDDLRFMDKLAKRRRV